MNLNYLQICPLLITFTEDLPFDIYLKQNNEYVLYATKHNFKNEHKLKLYDLKIENLYINTKDKILYNEYVEKKLPYLMNDPSIPIKEKGKIIYKHSLELASGLFRKTEKEYLKNIQYYQIINLVDNIFNFISSASNGIYTMQKLITTSYHDYVHSINTAVYAIGLFIHHSTIYDNEPMPKKSEIKQLGVAAILHDIGKIKLPKYLITKQEQLTSDEKKLIHLHPIYGVELCQLMDLESIITNVILFHHEKLDGSGYPCGTKNVPKYAKIVGIADIYSAMICDRPYRKKLTSFQSLKYLSKEAELGRLDELYVNSFIQLISTNQFVC